MTAGTEIEALAEKFAAELAAYHKVAREKITLDFDSVVTQVPGFISVVGTTPKGIVRGWVRHDGLVVIIRRTSLTPLVDALHLAETPPPFNDDQVAEILTWGYGVRHTLLRKVNKGELGMKVALSAPPMREIRESDGATVFRWLVRIEEKQGPIIMHYQIERFSDGTYKYNGWQLAPKNNSYARDDDE